MKHRHIKMKYTKQEEAWKIPLEDLTHILLESQETDIEAEAIYEETIAEIIPKLRKHSIYHQTVLQQYTLQDNS